MYPGRMYPGGEGGVLGSSFAGYVPLASQNPYPIINTVYFWSILLSIINPILVTFEQISDFLTLKVPKKCDPILVTLFTVHVIFIIPRDDSIAL